MVDLFPNPERHWHAERQAPALSATEIEKRVGFKPTDVRPLSGGLANKTFLINGDRVLKIYDREPASLAIEAALLAADWTTFRSPEILDRGPDFLILEFVAHGPLAASRRHGEAVGAALAEISEKAFSSAGFFDAELNIEKPFATNYFDAMLMHLRSLDASGVAVVGEALSSMERQSDHLKSLKDSPVLLHGDFKASNLLWTANDRLLILDWEFAHAGPVWMSLGQATRWGWPSDFALGFEAAFGSAHGPLIPQWRAIAEVYDLGNLIGLLANSSDGSRRKADLIALIEQRVAALRA